MYLSPKWDRGGRSDVSKLGISSETNHTSLIEDQNNKEVISLKWK